MNTIYHTIFLFFGIVLIFISQCTIANAQIIKDPLLSHGLSGDVEQQTIEKGTELKEALFILEETFGVYFLYRSQLLDQKIVPNVEELYQNRELSDILQSLLNGSDLTYRQISRRTIGIAPIDSEEEVFDVMQETVKGTVVDAITGETLPGVNVVAVGSEELTGSTIGTTTDINGAYELAVPEGLNILAFTYIGYQRLEISINGSTEIDVQLEQDVQMLADVVVVGYGTQQRRDVTGSLRQISGTEIAAQPSVQTNSALMGKIPGLSVQERSGQPGENQPTIRLRGITTLGSSSPLVLIDGVESSFSDVKSSDIESVTVLKDASSAAIYGSRAANGVILVTTKRGLSEGLEVNYRTIAGVRSAVNHPKFTDAGTFMRLENEALTNVGSSSVWSDEFISAWEVNHQTNPDQYPNTDWVSEVYSETALQQSHNLSIAGGTERVRYRGSLGYDNETGEIPNSGFQRYDVRLNTDIRASQKVDLSLDLNLQRRDREAPSASTYDIRRNAYRIPPIYPAQYSHGGWGVGWNNDNPVAFANDGGIDNREMYELRGRFNMRVRPIENLDFNVMYAPYYFGVTMRQMNKRYSVTSIESPDEVVALNPSRNSLRWQQDYQFRNTFNSTLEYSLDLNNQSVRLLGGFEYIDNVNQYIRADRQDFQLQDFEVINAGSPDTQTNQGSRWDWAIASFFGRANYSFLDRYLLEANLRYDGSSRFAEGNRWGLFPSFSAGWIISDESFMSGVGFISSLKVRASWGKLGNQNIGTYPFASVISLNQPGILGGNPVPGAGQTALANLDISWETTTSKNIGLDLELFDNRVFMNIDLFDRRTEDILLQLPIPRILGKSAPYQNAGIVDNRGWEFEAGYLGMIGSDFNYSISFNISDVKNEVIDLRGTGPFPGTQATMEGQPIGVIYGYESDGLFQTQGEIDDHPTQFGTIAPGDIRYVDQNGDGVINDEDRVALANPFPRLEFGFNLRANYKNFDVSAFFQGVGKRDVYLSGDAAWAFNNGGKIAQWMADDYWRPDNTSAIYPRLTHASSHNNFRVSDYWIFDASYLRLRNLQIGYTLPVHITERLQLRGLRVFVLGQNLFTIQPSLENGGLPPGIDANVPSTTPGGFYPVTRFISGGLEINF